MVTVNNATDEHRIWVHGHANKFAEFRTGFGVDVIFDIDDLKKDAKLEELLNMGAGR